jgi:hypothetical protein
MRTQSLFAVALLAVIAFPAGAQQRAPQGTRIAGKIKSVTANQVMLATANGDIDVAVTPHTRVLVRQSASVSDIKPGAYLGTSNQDSGANSTAGVATEVHLADNGPNVNFPMNKSGLTMTNGHVKTVTSTPAGEEIDINYGQSTTRHVLVKKDTVITKMKEVGIAGLKPDLEVNAMTNQGTDGSQTATFILVGAAPAAPQPQA